MAALQQTLAEAEVRAKRLHSAFAHYFPHTNNQPTNTHMRTQARGAEAARFKAALGTSQAEGEQLRTQLKLATGALESAELKLGAADERCAALAGQGAYVV